MAVAVPDGTGSSIIGLVASAGRTRAVGLVIGFRVTYCGRPFSVHCMGSRVEKHTGPLNNFTCDPVEAPWFGDPWAYAVFFKGHTQLLKGL